MRGRRAPFRRPRAVLELERQELVDVSLASKQLGQHASLGTTIQTLYTVPAGKRTIVKSLTCKNLALAANYVTFTFGDSGGDRAYYALYMTAAPTDGDTKPGEVWIVLNAGQFIKAVAHAASVGVIVSGAELTL